MKLPFLGKSKKHLEKSLQSLQQKIKKNPENIRLHVKVAELYLEHDMPREAIQEYLYAARQYQSKRSPQIVIALYEHVISIDPGQVDVYHEMADYHIRNGYIGDGVAVLEKLATYYNDQDMRYEATQVLKKIIDLDPTNDMISKKVARFFDAKAQAELVEDTNAKDKKKSSGTIGKIFSAKKEVDFFDLETALDGDTTINITGNAADVESESVGLDTVFEELRSLIDEAPMQDTPEFHYNLGKAFQRCGEFEEAIQEYLTALYGHKDKVACYLQLGQCSLALNRFEAAEGFIEEGLELMDLSKDERAVLYYQLGIIYKAEGNKEKALAVFQQMYDTGYTSRVVKNQIESLK